MYCSDLTISLPFTPIPAPLEPVGMATAAKDQGTQFIELSPHEKDFVAVADEVCETCLYGR